jgi:hypothetical protein
VRRGNPPVEASTATCLGVDVVSREPGSTEKKRGNAPARAANGGFANPAVRMLQAADTDRIAGANRGRTACCRTRAVSVSAPPDIPYPKTQDVRAPVHRLSMHACAGTVRIAWISAYVYHTNRRMHAWCEHTTHTMNAAARILSLVTVLA